MTSKSKKLKNPSPRPAYKLKLIAKAHKKLNQQTELLKHSEPETEYHIDGDGTETNRIEC